MDNVQKNSIFIDHSNYAWQRVEVMKLLIMQFSPISRHFMRLRYRYSAQHPVPKHPQSRNVRDKVLHPYVTTDKIIVLYIIIFMFLDSRRKDKTFWSEW
jgi:uncharacterized protein with HEPN domain